MLSYPHGPGSIKGGKTINRPDMSVMAAIAEAAKLDIRFLVLLRNAGAVLNSTMDGRHFGRGQPQILVANAEAMYAQLALLSPAFYRCLTYDDLVHNGLLPTQRSRLIDFLHPVLLNVERLDHMLKKVHLRPTEQENIPSVKVPDHTKNESAILAAAANVNGNSRNNDNRTVSTPAQRRKGRILYEDEWVTEEGRMNRRYQELLLQARINMIHKLCTEQQAWL